MKCIETTNPGESFLFTGVSTNNYGKRRDCLSYANIASSWAIVAL